MLFLFSNRVERFLVIAIREGRAPDNERETEQEKNPDSNARETTRKQQGNNMVYLIV
jgi:hypothetical protein